MHRRKFKPARTLAARCIDLCIGWWADVEPPGWLRKAIRHSATFRKSSDDLDAFTDQLKRDAPDWTQLHTGFPNQGGRSHVVVESAADSRDQQSQSDRNLSIPDRRLFAYVAAISATIAIMFVWRLSAPGKQPIGPAKPTIMTEEKPSAVLEDEMQAIARIVEGTWNSSETYIASVSSAIKTPMPTDRQLIGDAISQRVRSFSRSYGQTVDFVTKHVDRLKSNP